MALYWYDGKRKTNTINISQYWPQSIFQLLDVELQWIEDWDILSYNWATWTITPIKIQQWVWYIDVNYLYKVYWVDWNWDVERYERSTMIKTTTWIQTWIKPTTLSEVQNLIYN